MSPIAGQAVVGVTPTISISYTADPSLAIDISTLSVQGNGIEWSARFQPAGPNAANYTVSVTDNLVAGKGALRIVASVRDTAGTLASDSKEYDVLPVLEALAPAAGFPADSATGRRGETVTVAGVGLAPEPHNNVLRFRSLFLNGQGQFSPIDAPFVSVADDRTKGQIEVPEGAVSGDVPLVVNNATSREALPFDVQPALEHCGTPHQILPLPNGGFLVWMISTTNGVSPRCPNGLRNVLLRYGDDGISVLEDPNPTNDFWAPDIVGVALDKTGLNYALLLRAPVFGNEAWELTIRYKGNETKIPFASTWERNPSSAAVVNQVGGTAAAFDEQGHLYIAYSEGEWLPQPPWGAMWYVPVSLNVGLVSKESLASGGAQPLQPVLENVAPTGIMEYPSRRPGRLRIRCDGTAYVSAMDNSSGIVKVLSLKGPGASSSIGDIDPSVDTIVDIVPTVVSEEVLGTGWRIVEDDNRTVAWRAIGSGASQIGEIRQERIPLLTVTPGGAVLLHYGLNSIPSFINVAGLRVSPHDAGAGATAMHYPCPTPPPPPEILPSTTRWRPQRDQSKKVEVKFKGPYDLASAKLIVKGVTAPDGTSVPFPSDYAPDTEPFDPNVKNADSTINGPTYKLVWIGPWTLPDGQPLPRGHYTIVVSGKRKDQTEEIMSDPFDKVSLVEVIAIRLEAVAGAPPLDTNPNVPRLPWEPSNRDREGGGLRIFSEAVDAPRAGSPTPKVFDRVRVVATIEPAVADATGNNRVRVYFKSFDVDRAERSPLDDESKPFDNCTTSDAAHCYPIPHGYLFDIVSQPNSPPLTVPTIDILVPGGSEAVVGLVVSRQQGDNYRVAASTSAQWLGRLEPLQDVGEGELRHTSEPLVPPGTTPFQHPQVSAMLTVWRTLHLELDRFFIAPGFEDFGERALDYNGQWSGLQSKQLRDNHPAATTNADHPLPLDWVGGRLSLAFHANHWYPVTAASVDSNGVTHVDVDVPSGQPNLLNQQQPGNISVRDYTLRDDEIRHFLRSPNHDTSLLGAILARTYVRVMDHRGDDVNPQPEISWRGLVYTSDLINNHQQLIPRDTVSSPSYWAVPVVLAFEGAGKDFAAPTFVEVQRQTHDPTQANTTGLFGYAPPLPWPVGRQPVAVSFVETIRDAVETKARNDPLRPSRPMPELLRSNVAHEVLHTLGLYHSGGIMCATKKNYQQHSDGYLLTDKQVQKLMRISGPGPGVVDEAVCGTRGAPNPPDCCPAVP